MEEIKGEYIPNRMRAEWAAVTAEIRRLLAERAAKRPAPPRQKIAYTKGWRRTFRDTGGAK